MSGVVLRCPSCGTTKAAPGECDACHEAQVRYYCTNHKPGRWLELPSCPQCGSQFGVPDRAPPARPPAPPAPSRTATTPPSPEAPHPRARKGYTSWPLRGPWGSRRGPRDERETRSRKDAIRDALERRLPELLREAARARRAREPEMPTIGAAAGGCLRAALLIVLFFMLAFFALSTLLGGLLIQW